MKKFPITCPLCGNREMFFQAFDHDEDNGIQIIGSACLDCRKAWVLSKENLKNHSHLSCINEIEEDK